MKKIVAEPLTNLTTSEFERFLKEKLKDIIDKKIIVGFQPVERSMLRGLPCFRVRIQFGEQDFVDFSVDKWRKVAIYRESPFDENPVGCRWAGTAFAKYVAECIAEKRTRVKEPGELRRILQEGRTALDRGSSRIQW